VEQKLKQLIEEKFSFLVTEYAAKIKVGDDFEFQLKKSSVVIQKDRSDLFLYIKNNLSDEELEIGQIVTFALKNIRHGYGKIVKGGTVEIITHYSDLVKLYCDDFLNGDFAQYDDIKNYMTKINSVL
jgi:hypothetical protein